MRIDMHAHLVPQRALDVLGKDSALYNVEVLEASSGGQCFHFDPGPTIRPFLQGLRDFDMRWKAMEQASIDHQILSVWADCLGYTLEPDKGARWSRLLNETTAEIVQQHPHRLSMMATVPLQDGERAARELEYGVQQCGAVGAVIVANMDGDNLDAPHLQSFWEAAAELRAPVLIHPSQPIPLARTSKYNMGPICQYTYDSTVTAGYLINSGVLDRNPALTFVLCHGGGYFPYQVGRFDVVYQNYPGQGEFPAHNPSSYLRRFFYDTILHAPEPLIFLKNLVGTDRLLLGTDYPFPVQDTAPLALYQRAGLTDDEVEAIGYKNIVELYGLKIPSA